MPVPKTIVCVECGGPCGLRAYEPVEGFQAGDVVAYRCRDCVERFDVVVDADDLEDGTPD